MLENAKTPVDLEARDSPPKAEGWHRRVLPSALILAVLIGLAYWGHETGWRIGGGGSSQHSDEPSGDIRPVIRTSREASHEWCAAHGVHGCPLDSPEVAQLDQPRSITPADFERPQRALSVRPRHENDPKFPFAGHRLQFPSREAVNRAGIDMTPASDSRVIEAIDASGEIQFYPTRVARLTSRAAGTARHVAKSVGDRVQADEMLALVDAVDVGKGKAEFLQAFVHARLKRTAWENLKNAGTSIPDRQLSEAEAALRDADTRLVAAEQSLTNLGLPIQAAEFGTLSTDEFVAPHPAPGNSKVGARTV